MKQTTPTTEQIRMAQLIEKQDQIIDDPVQKEKIQIVMDITKKPEDVVATALYDAEWDTTAAVGLLMEEGKEISGWKETKKMGRKKPYESPTENNDSQVLENKTINTRESNKQEMLPRQELPPRMRRGGNSYQDSRGRRGPRLDNERKNSNYENNNNPERKDNDNNNRYDRERQENRGMPRRGRGQGYRGGNSNRRGNGRGGNRGSQRGRGRQDYEQRDTQWESEGQTIQNVEGQSVPMFETNLISQQLESDAYVVGFSGNIESWNPEHSASNISEQNSVEKIELSNPVNVCNDDGLSSWAKECAEETDDSLEKVPSPDKFEKCFDGINRSESRTGIYRPPPARQTEQAVKTGSQVGFGGVESWNRKSPVVTSWDDEYTGSLADTKVFTASSTASRNKQISDTINQDTNRNRVITESSTSLQLPQFSRQKQNDVNWMGSNKPHSTLNMPSEDKMLASSAGVSRNDTSDNPISNELRNTQATQTASNLPPPGFHKEYNNTQTRNELKNSQATQTISNQSSGFQSDYNNPMNLSAINQMLLRQGQSPMHQIQAPFPTQQTMSSTMWLPAQGNLQQQVTSKAHNEPMAHPSVSANIKTMTPKRDNSADMYASNANSQESKNATTEFDVQSMAGRSVSSATTGLDLRQHSSYITRNLAPFTQLQQNDAFHRSRLAQPSKIPDSAVEMPGGYSTRLDIQFGNLDLSTVRSSPSEQPTSIAQSRYAGSLGTSNSQSLYATSPPTNPVVHQLQKGMVTSASSSSQPMRAQNHPSMNGSQSSYVPTVQSNVMNQYFSPLKPNQSRPYGSAVPAVPNNPNQYVGQVPPYGAWMDAQREQQFCYVDPNVINYLNPYGAYNVQN